MDTAREKSKSSSINTHAISERNGWELIMNNCKIEKRFVCGENALQCEFAEYPTPVCNIDPNQLTCKYLGAKNECHCEHARSDAEIVEIQETENKYSGFFLDINTEVVCEELGITEPRRKAWIKALMKKWFENEYDGKQ